MDRLWSAYQESFWSMVKTCSALPILVLKESGCGVTAGGDYRVIIKESVSSVLDVKDQVSPEAAMAGAMRHPIPPSAKAVTGRTVEVYKKTDDGGYDLISGLPSIGAC